MATLKYSAEGVKSLERELDSLKTSLRKLQIYKNKLAAENGDVWHDNNDFEQCEIEERRLSKSIADLEEKIKNIEIISSSSPSKNTVNYGAIVKVKISGDDEELDDDDVITLLFSDSDQKVEYQKTNANTPIGKVIFGESIGFIGNYTVNNKGVVTTFTVEILDVQYPES